MNFDSEQDEILKLSDELDKTHGRSWYKYKGDVINRRIIELLVHHIDPKYFIAGPSVFIENIPIEFDALVVKKNVQLITGTNAYRKSDVKLLIEVKKHGFYFKKIEGVYKIKEYFKQFLDINIPFVYLTVKESKTFINATKTVFPENSFFLCVSYGDPVLHEWQRFVERVSELIK